jgi:hypothetical protein
MIPYHHTQPGTVVRWALLAGLLPLVSTLWAPIPREVLVPLMGLVTAISAATVALLWSLTIEVTPARFRFWFGPGLIGKSVPLARVRSCEPVGGLLAWGIHWAGKRGWLYNVSGRKAVSVNLVDGTAFLVGTDEPEAVCAAVVRAQAARAAAADSSRER